ncbi:MAG: hypothetical protein PVF54_06795 [Anaerolineae bacterium]|jgi:formamidopyrimidine-DNA glycosylase
MYITFADDSFLTATTRMWGAMELYEKGEEENRQHVKGMRTTPLEAQFTFDYFGALVDELVEGKTRSAKALLTQDQIIPGLGNAIAQDILFRAGLHPRHPIADLSAGQRRLLYRAIVDTVRAVIEKGGRYDEYDLHDNRGGYVRMMDKNALGRPCPRCGGEIEKIQYLGGSCYLCPECQE